MRIILECLTGSLAGKRLEFDQAQITLGRGELQPKDVDFADSDAGVSREHGLIVAEGERVFYTDRSRGGTLIDGQRIVGTTVELTSGLSLQLGSRNGPQLKIYFQPLLSPALADLANATVLQITPPVPPSFAYDAPTSPQPPPRPTLKQSEANDPTEATCIQSDQEPPTRPVNRSAEATYIQEGQRPPEPTYIQEGQRPAPPEPTYVQPSPPPNRAASYEQTYAQPPAQTSEAEATYVQAQAAQPNLAEQTFVQTAQPKSEFALPSWLPWVVLSLVSGIGLAVVLRYLLP